MTQGLVGIAVDSWGADLARVSGVPEDKVGEFHGNRAPLKAGGPARGGGAAVAYALTGGDPPQTVGSPIPVDSGDAAVFLP